MQWRNVVAVAAVAVAVAAVALQQRRIIKVSAERDRYIGNTARLMMDVQRYRVNDSVQASRVRALELTAAEYKRLRDEDAALIGRLKARNRDLSAVNKTQSETIIRLSAIPRDTIIIRDSIETHAVSVHCSDAWFDFSGLLLPDREFSGSLRHRDSLLLVEPILYNLRFPKKSEETLVPDRLYKEQGVHTTPSWA